MAKPMNLEFLTKWQERLTDGTFRAVRCQLVGDSPYERCCLGVARQVASELGLLPSITADELKLRGKRHAETLPMEEWKAMGMSSVWQGAFARANDNHVVPPGQFYPREVLDLVQTLIEEAKGICSQEKRERQIG